MSSPLDQKPNETPEDWDNRIIAHWESVLRQLSIMGIQPHDSKYTFAENKLAKCRAHAALRLVASQL